MGPAACLTLPVQEWLQCGKAAQPHLGIACIRMLTSGPQAVMAVDEERQRLERDADLLLGDESEEAQTRLEDLYERYGAHLMYLPSQSSMLDPAFCKTSA